MFNLLGFERRVALRFLREGRMQTLLIIVGVAAGVAVVAYISALITGLQRNTLDKTLGAQAHVTLSAPDDVVLAARAPAAATTALTQTQPRAQRPRSIANWQALVPILEAMPAVAAVSPMVAGAGVQEGFTRPLYQVSQSILAPIQRAFAPLVSDPRPPT